MNRHNTIMARVSKIKLDKLLENQILDQFWTSLSFVNNSVKSQSFYSDLFSTTERLMLAKRFAVAILLYRGKSATEIHDAIHVSYSNIGSVTSWVKNGKPGTQELLNKISRMKSWGAIIDSIDTLLDKLPPKRHSDWVMEYKNRKIRLQERLAKQRIR